MNDANMPNDRADNTPDISDDQIAAARQYAEDLKAGRVKPGGKPAAGPRTLRPIEALGAALDNPVHAAGPAPGSHPPPPADEPALPPSEPGGPASEDRLRGQIWKGCPVRPLGVSGATYYYLDVLGQMRGITKHDAQNLMMLFGRNIAQLCWHFPKWLKDPEGGTYRKLNHFDHQNAAVAIIAACSECGIFDPENSVRGVGAWSDDDGQLVYHMGDKLLIADEEREPGLYQGKLYPALRAIPHPALTVNNNAAAEATLAAFETWQWDRPDLDPVLLLGMTGVQMFGGALDWRPAFWISGGAGAGKSALQRLMLHLHGGDAGLIQSTDATARGLAALLGQSTLPVALDEIEPGDQGSTKEKQIIETARVAASGGRWARGSSDQKGSTGQLRSTFLFSSIIRPGVLDSQDLQRIIPFDLRPFAEGAKAPDMRPDLWRKRGAAIKRQIIDRWPTWAKRLDLWREALAGAGVHGRDADNWATTMAMAQMIQSADLPAADALAGWAAKVARAVGAARGDANDDAAEVVMHLMSRRYRVEGGREEYTIAQWLMVAARSPGAPAGLLSGYGSDDQGQDERAELANAKLSKALIKVIRDKTSGARLFIGNSKHCQTLNELFMNTKWVGGAWSQSLSRIKGAVPSRGSRTLAGTPTRGMEIPFSALPGLMAFPQDQDRPMDAGPAPRPPEHDMEGF